MKNEALAAERARQAEERRQAEESKRTEEARVAAAKAEAERKAKAEAERIVAEKAEAERKAREAAERVAKEKRKAEEARIAEAKAEAERKASLETVRLAEENRRAAKKKASRQGVVAGLGGKVAYCNFEMLARNLYGIDASLPKDKQKTELDLKIKKLRPQVGAYGKLFGYTLIMDSNSLLFCSPRTENLTDSLIEYLRAHQNL